MSPDQFDLVFVSVCVFEPVGMAPLPVVIYDLNRFLVMVAWHPLPCDDAVGLSNDVVSDLATYQHSFYFFLLLLFLFFVYLIVQRAERVFRKSSQ